MPAGYGPNIDSGEMLDICYFNFTTPLQIKFQLYEETWLVMFICYNYKYQSR